MNVGLAPLSQCDVYCTWENMNTHAQSVRVFNVYPMCISHEIDDKWGRQPEAPLKRHFIFHS